MKKWIRFILILVAVAAMIAAPPFAMLRSMAIMSVYSSTFRAGSIESERGFRVSIPAGVKALANGWYPLMLFYDTSDEYAWQTGTQTSLNIYYSFASFDPLRGCSRLYDPDSPYYLAFYGAYVVSGEETGMDATGHPVPEEVVKIMRFDLFELVLDDFGLREDQRVFEWDLTGTEELAEWGGMSKVTRMDAVITMNGPAHEGMPGVLSYLQYGYPLYPAPKPLAPATFYGRLYGHYLEDKGVSVYFYILAADPDVVEACDRKLLSASRVRTD